MKAGHFADIGITLAIASKYAPHAGINAYNTSSQNQVSVQSAIVLHGRKNERDGMNETLQVLTAALAATLALYIWLCWLIGVALI
jgi:hypothetical protein